MVPKPLHHPEVFQTWVPRPENAEPLAVALILHSILALGLRLYSREGSPPCCSPPPSFPALGGPPQRRLRWDVSRGIQAEKPFQDQRLCSYLLLETEHRFGFTPPEELPVPAQALGSASRVLPLSFRCRGLRALILVDNVFFLHLACQLISKPYHI